MFGVAFGSEELSVRVMGELAVCRAGRVLRAAEIGSRKARTLLAVLAVYPGPVLVDRIADVLWGDTAPCDPVANVATLASRLRAALGPNTIVGGRGAYRLADAVWVDLIVVAGLVDDAERWIRRKRPDLALAAARRAMSLLDAGGVLSGEPEARWAEPARAQHGQLVRRGWHAFVESALWLGDVRAARTVAEVAVTADAFDEVACRLLMRVCHAAGEPARALLAFHRLRATLATELGVDPAPATRELHVAILRDTAGQATG